MDIEVMIKRTLVEHEQKWTELIQSFPWISFPADWQVRVIPPFSGATARFYLRLPGGEEVSVYADHFNALGYYGGPYWEVYPYKGDVGRCDLDDVDELLRMIGDRDD